MRLRLTFLRSENESIDLTVEVDDKARVKDLTAALLRNFQPHFSADPPQGSREKALPQNQDSHLSDSRQQAPHRQAFAEQRLGILSLCGKTDFLDPESKLSDLNIASGLAIFLADSKQVVRPAVARIGFLDPKHKTVYLPVGTKSLGRDPQNDVILNDPMVSKRHAFIYVASDRVEIVDNGSANGVIVDGARVSRARIFGSEKILLGQTVLKIGFRSAHEQVAPFWRVRSAAQKTYFHKKFKPKKVVASFVENNLEQEKAPWLLLLFPLPLGAALFLLTGNLNSLIFVFLSPLFMLGSWANRRLQLNKKKRAEDHRFEKYVRYLKKRLAKGQLSEVKNLSSRFPDVKEILRRIASEQLWWLPATNGDLFKIRVGRAKIKARTTLKLSGEKGPTENDKQLELRKLKQEFQFITEAPVVLDIKNNNIVGVSGPVSTVVNFAKAVILQLVSRVPPEQMPIFAFLDGSWANALHDIKWLPHIRSAEKLSSSDSLATTLAEAKTLLRLLETERLAIKEGSSWLEDPFLIIFAAGNSETEQVLELHEKLTLVDSLAQTGAVFLWLSEDHSLIPSVCKKHILLENNLTAQIIDTVKMTRLKRVSVETLQNRDFASACRQLAGFQDAQPGKSASAELPSVINIFELLKADPSLDWRFVVDRWGENKAMALHTKKFSLRATIGASQDGPVNVDLRENGPHALVGGTTGSGKSEFLQTWITAMALEHDPDEVNFLFIDYKGGAAFSDCTRLPHSVGLVTDLDSDLMGRMLISLRAEINFRERLFLRYGAKDLDEYQLHGENERPELPALVIVVDEFAALLEDIPEFLDGVIDIAQRGRSLGVHLILATQRPAGVIKGSLRANTNLRVALRVADDFESTDIIGTNDAAFFDAGRPGLAAIKIASDRPKIFQSAYLGVSSANSDRMPGVILRKFNFGTDSLLQNEVTPSRNEGSTSFKLEKAARTDLQALVETISSAANKNGFKELRKPFLPPLHDFYNVADLVSGDSKQINFFMLDAPEEQTQRATGFKPELQGHLLATGSSGSGKTTLLRSLAVAALLHERDEEAHVYAIDFGFKGLQDLKELPHVGGVFGADEKLAIQKLLKFLEQELLARSEMFARSKVKTLSSYNSVSGDKEPRILLVLDGFEEFRKIFEGDRFRQQSFERLLKVFAAGRSLGIHVAITAVQEVFVPVAVREQALLKIKLADEKLSQRSIPGRGVVDKNEIQVADIVSVERFKKGLTENKSRVQKIETIGPDLSREDLRLQSAEHTVIALAEETFEQIFLPSSGVFLIAHEQKGSAASCAVLASASRATGQKLIVLGEEPAPCNECLEFGIAPSPLHGLEPDSEQSSQPGAVWARVIDPAQINAYIQELTSADQKYYAAEEKPVFVVTDPQIFSSLTAEVFNKFLGLCRANEWLLLVISDSKTLQQSFGVIARLKTGAKGILFDFTPHAAENVFGMAPPSYHPEDLPQGSGFFFDSQKALLVRVPKCGQ